MEIKERFRSLGGYHDGERVVGRQRRVKMGGSCGCGA